MVFGRQVAKLFKVPNISLPGILHLGKMPLKNEENKFSTKMRMRLAIPFAFIILFYNFSSYHNRFKD